MPLNNLTSHALSPVGASLLFGAVAATPVAVLGCRNRGLTGTWPSPSPAPASSARFIPPSRAADAATGTTRKAPGAAQYADPGDPAGGTDHSRLNIADRQANLDY